jgi:hypothetical protein
MNSARSAIVILTFILYLRRFELRSGRAAQRVS